MKLANVRDSRGIHLAIQCEQGFINVPETAAKLGIIAPNSVDDAIEKGTEMLESLVCEQAYFDTCPTFAPAVLHPEKILCVGLNYKKHSAEFKQNLPQEPLLFGKFNNALAAHRQIIALPQNSTQIDYEAELVIVIGKKAKNVSVQNALQFVFGYTIGNDLTARDLQMKSSQWLIGKGTDNFAPIGPVVNTDICPNNLEICCKLNGEVRQQDTTANMIFSCAEIVSYASQMMTLNPGDIIFTGTPSGVIYGRTETDKRWLMHGDKLEVSIEGIGTLENTLD